MHRESGVHFFVYSGADWVSQRVIPNQKVGRSWKFQVLLSTPLSFGSVLGSFGSVTVYVTSLPEPGISDLKRTEGSSWPT